MGSASKLVGAILDKFTGRMEKHDGISKLQKKYKAYGERLVLVEVVNPRKPPDKRVIFRRLYRLGRDGVLRKYGFVEAGDNGYREPDARLIFKYSAFLHLCKGTDAMGRPYTPLIAYAWNDIDYESKDPYESMEGAVHLVDQVFREIRPELQHLILPS